MKVRRPQAVLTEDEKSVLMNATHDLDRMGCACQPVWDAVEQIIESRMEPFEYLAAEWAGQAEAALAHGNPAARTHSAHAARRLRIAIREALNDEDGDGRGVGA